MYHHCNRWSRRYAFATAYNDPPFYQSRHHRGANFGVRRPLRYLSHRLDLDEGQRRRIAAVLDRLKTDREQARLDEKKTVSDLAALVTQPDVSMDDLRKVLAPRVESTETLQVSIAKAVQEIVDILDSDQREEFAYLLRSGVVQL